MQGKTGIDAGNAICQARATAAGLPGTYNAWISTSTTDAYCNVQGYTGQISANCGQTTLPVAAGPWVRTDGMPFAPTIDKMTASPNLIYTPLDYDEFGNLIATSGYIVGFTNTLPEGTMFTGASWNACSDWTIGVATSGQGVVGGHIPDTIDFWTEGWGFDCSQTGHLLCMQTGAGVPLPTVNTAGKKVFITSVTGTGYLGGWADAGVKAGIAAGDAICQARAAHIVPPVADPTKFKAWLSVTGTNAVARLTSSGPWVRPDGIMVAKDKSALTFGLISGWLFTSISQDENGNYSAFRPWTGTNYDGTALAGQTCNDWADGTTGSNGEFGNGAGASTDWTAWGSTTCDATYSLYCFEDD